MSLKNVKETLGYKEYRGLIRALMHAEDAWIKTIVDYLSKNTDYDSETILEAVHEAVKAMEHNIMDITESDAIDEIRRKSLRELMEQTDEVCDIMSLIDGDPAFDFIPYYGEEEHEE